MNNLTDNEKLTNIINKYIDDYKKKRTLSFVVKNSIPIVFFGDLEKYLGSETKVLSVGLNPSNKEFPINTKRFDTDIDFEASDCTYMLINTLNSYFKKHPYEWFNKYEKLLNAANCSYYDKSSISRTAIHIDIYSAIATNPTWGGLSSQQKQVLQNTLLFQELLEFLSPEKILISVNQEIFSKIFWEWREITKYDFPGKNRIIVKERNGKIVINGTNMMGVPFGGMKEVDVKKIIAKHFL